MKNIITLCALIVLVGAGCAQQTDPNTTGDAITGDALPKEVQRIADIPVDAYTHNALLEDVNNGRTIRGTEFTPDSAGTAGARFVDGEYQLRADFVNLPKPQNGDFYEGWVVRRNPLSIVSTGELIYTNHTYVNIFTSDIDYTDHDKYVLTLEPDDGDPAPADHIVDGVFVTFDRDIETFVDCVAAGNPVMESYPRQCRANGKTFVEQIFE